ncbi:hypothetical protein KR026_007518 [Drosophila bipectinata]|nr:hypothetical protein KR026_007518 [Drosophila bipectinata]
MEDQKDLSKFLKPFIRQEVGILFKELANQACDNQPTSTEIMKYKRPYSNEGFYHYKCTDDSDDKDAKDTKNDGEGALICEICEKSRPIEHQMTLVRYNPNAQHENLDDQSDQDSIKSCDTLVAASEVEERPEAYELTAYMRDEPWTTLGFRLTINENDLIIESRMTSNSPQPDDEPGDSRTLIRSTPIKDEEEEFGGQDGLLVGAATPRICYDEEGVIQGCEITEITSEVESEITSEVETEISSEVETDISSEVKSEIMMKEEPKTRYVEVRVQVPGTEYSAKPRSCYNEEDVIQDCKKNEISSEVKSEIMMEKEPKNRYVEVRVQGPRAEYSARPRIFNDKADVIQDCKKNEISSEVKTDISSEVKTEIMMEEKPENRYVEVLVQAPGAEYSTMPSLICDDEADVNQDCEKTEITSEVKTEISSEDTTDISPKVETEIMMKEEPKTRYAEVRVKAPGAEYRAKPRIFNDKADVIQDCKKNEISSEVKTDISSEVKTEMMMKEEPKTRYVKVRLHVPGAEYSAKCGRFEKEVPNEEPKPPFYHLVSQEAEYHQNESMIRWPKDYQVRPCDERRIMPRDGDQVAMLPPDMKAPVIPEGGLACFVPLQPRTIITSEPLE